jgi:hypothetical protein
VGTHPVGSKYYTYGRRRRRPWLRASAACKMARPHKSAPCQMDQPVRLLARMQAAANHAAAPHGTTSQPRTHARTPRPARQRSSRACPAADPAMAAPAVGGGAGPALAALALAAKKAGASSGNHRASMAVASRA